MDKPQPYILLIDDDEDDLEMFSSELNKKGIKVKAFDSSTKALVYLMLMSEVGELPCLIILDFNMPKKDGHQVLLSIKENKDTKNIPVVCYSTGMNNLLKTELLEHGAFDCFTKPWNYTELNTQVNIFQELAHSFIKNNNIAWKKKL